ncbi:anhydro-N-acetylmuramic acid kinase [cyanobacterium endosymbiont of Braarudosphaera bigelowii]|uniref:Anhydro-N-acetylmuramic acid kinase n=2 Tax=Candidatus Atelocyanobacterium thalassae TaxID=713887 RepID=A0ABN6JZA6_9CHRO|nr:anhydro-N-acetylmuramic acid kinase [cyanobacterium endosymbiont of Braarudosphaera bigelowii]
MSGTSVDSIDAALIKIQGSKLDLRIKYLLNISYSYPEKIRNQILRVAEGNSLSIEEFAKLDEEIALSFVNVVKEVRKKHFPIELIGSHGQTVFHRPPAINSIGYTIQLGRGEIIANLTGIPTVNNFRAADIAAGGQGAPLVSAVDACLLSHPHYHRCIQNIGGIGNVTYLPPKCTEDWYKNITGWDTGPGNMLIDLTINKLSNGKQFYDSNGIWASQGKPNYQLIEKWLNHDFFHKKPPKSTGRELFGEEYLEYCWNDAQAYKLSETDFLTTITELTAISITNSYKHFIKYPIDEILLCGGGSHNLYLKERINHHSPQNTIVKTTTEVGLNSDFKEAISFAVLAYWRYVSKIPGSLPQVTGAYYSMLLGDVYLPF